MKKTIYIIKYQYYQYNSGQADNGNYSKKIELDDSIKAKLIYQKFRDYLDNKLSDDDKRSLEDDYIPYAGYFTEVTFLKSMVEDYDLNLKKNIYEDFRDCPECFSEEDGYSSSCECCGNTGSRQLTMSSINLALSAQEWVDEKVRELWSVYNKVFQLNYGLSKWNINTTTIDIQAGYSCRGSVYEEWFELKMEWLLNPEREELIKKFKDELDIKENAKKKIDDLEKLNQLKKSIKDLEAKIKQ